MHEISEERIKKNINYQKHEETSFIVVNKLQMIKLTRINLS